MSMLDLLRGLKEAKPHYAATGGREWGRFMPLGFKLFRPEVARVLGEATGLLEAARDGRLELRRVGVLLCGPPGSGKVGERCGWSAPEALSGHCAQRHVTPTPENSGSCGCSPWPIMMTQRPYCID